MTRREVKMKYDFSGWASRNDLKCSDGRTIRRDAFKDCNGKKVPLVWMHKHDDVENVLGHAYLENRPEGVYTYAVFNQSAAGQRAKEAVRHGDVTALSIYANKLKQNGGDVLHGNIREVSLVLAGANPGAYIENVSLAHGSNADGEFILYTGDDIVINDNNQEFELMHEDKGGKTIQDIFDTLNEEQQEAVYALIGMALENQGKEMQHADEDEDGDLEYIEDEVELPEDASIEDVLDTLTPRQQDAVYELVGEAVQGGIEEMKHNLFENDNTQEQNVLSHDDMQEILADGKRYGSLKESFLEHGVTHIDYLFPEAKTLNNVPDFISRDMGWVKRVMNGVKRSPFSRVKSLFANITEDEARARGYIKGKLKKEEVFTLLKRSTSPTTIYKKQKIDRDDMIDITDFDVVAWIKGEMRLMLDEEIARAILVGDGRESSSDDKINEQNIRPIWKDEELYTVKSLVAVDDPKDGAKVAKAFIRSAIKSRKDYKGSGNPVLFTTEDVLTDMLLLEDTTGRTIYDSEEKLRTTLRVSEIITVPVMENQKRQDGAKKKQLLGIITNIGDYNVGADKGGAVNLFDDFDIDYNAQKYLIETRCSGALVKPYSAIALEIEVNE